MLVALALAGASPAPAQTGLLLGFANGDSASVLWLTRADGRFRVLRAPGMLVPRADGLWRIGTDTVLVRVPREPGDSAPGQRSDSAQANLPLVRLWAAPVGRQPAIAPADTQLTRDYLPGGTSAAGAQRTLALTFVGEEYLSIDEHLAVDTVFARAERSIGRLDSVAARGYAYPASGPASRAMRGLPADPHVTADFLKRHKEWCMKRASPSWWEPNGTLQPADSWGIVRGQGYWRYMRRFSVSRGANREFEYDCRVPFLPPAAFVGTNELRPAWSMVSARVPDARDAFSSPDGQYIVVLTTDELRVQRVSGPRLGALILRTAAPGLPVVQVRWARGADVARWSQELEAVPGATAAQARQLEERRTPARRLQPQARRPRHVNRGTRRSSSH